MICASETVLVVGTGNALLGDEGFGVHVARSLAAAGSSLPSRVAVLEAGTCLLDSLPEWPRYSHVIIVDAIRTGGDPGTVYRAEISAGLTDEPEVSPPISLHEWGVAESLRAAKMLGLLPARLTLIGAEPESIHPGVELSPAVGRAARRVVSMLLEAMGAAGIQDESL